MIIDYISAHWVEWIFTILSILLTYGYHQLRKQQAEQKTKNCAIGDGVQAILRDRIIQAYNYYQGKGYCPIYAKENMERMYKAYHALDGNDVATKLKDTLMAMPEEPDEEE